MPWKDMEAKRAYGRRWYEANRERKAARDKARHALPENKAKGREQSLADYYRRREAILAKKREEYAANRERALARNREWRMQHPEEYRESARRSYQKNQHWRRPETKQKRQQYYRDNRSKVREGDKRRRLADPDGYRLTRAKAWHKRRATLLSKDRHFTEAEWAALCKAYQHRCLRCGRSEPQIKLTVDHVIPLSSGGDNTIDNIQPLCGECNCIKGRQTIDFRTTPRLI